MICVDLWSHIIDYSKFTIKLKIVRLSKNCYNYGYIIEEIPKAVSRKLTDDILKQQKYNKINTLYASFNEKITF